MIKLFDTGWVIAKVENKIELVFKVGDSCPKHLPAHAHSDLLSFELFSNGMPLISEIGTSIYGNHKDRFYESQAKRIIYYSLLHTIHIKKKINNGLSQYKFGATLGQQENQKY